MNNLKYYEDTFAYDFSMFAPAQKKEDSEKSKVIDIPEAQKFRSRRRKQAASRISGKVTAALVTVFIIGTLAGSIYLRAQINETENKIAKIEEQINVADSQIASKNFELEQKIAYKNLESAAIALGMRKMEKNQIVYVRTVENDKVVPGGETAETANIPE